MTPQEIVLNHVIPGIGKLLLPVQTPLRYLDGRTTAQLHIHAVDHASV